MGGCEQRIGAAKVLSLQGEVAEAPVATLHAASPAGAIARLLDAPRVPAASEERSFSDLHRHLDQTIADLRATAPGDLEAALDRVIVVDHRRGSIRASGSQFLVAYAIPHFFYHVTSAYGILRNQGVPLTMGDLLGNWPNS